LTVQDDQLLAQESIFNDKICFTAAHVENYIQSQRDSGWFQPTFGLMLNPMRKRSPEVVGEEFIWYPAKGGWRSKCMIIQEE
jgi:hypothetical protein